MIVQGLGHGDRAGIAPWRRIWLGAALAAGVPAAVAAQSGGCTDPAAHMLCAGPVSGAESAASVAARKQAIIDAELSVSSAIAAGAKDCPTARKIARAQGRPDVAESAAVCLVAAHGQ